MPRRIHAKAKVQIANAGHCSILAQVTYQVQVIVRGIPTAASSKFSIARFVSQQRNQCCHKHAAHNAQICQPEAFAPNLPRAQTAGPKARKGNSALKRSNKRKQQPCQPHGEHAYPKGEKRILPVQAQYLQQKYARQPDQQSTREQRNSQKQHVMILEHTEFAQQKVAHKPQQSRPNLTPIC